MIHEDTATRDAAAHRDPITGAPGAHPVGTGVGALIGGAVVGGAAAGAATGTVAGPVGILIGATVGAVIGGLAGKGAAESIDPTQEEAYWRDNYAQRSYVEHDASFVDFGPAYGFGVDAYGRYPGRDFDDLEPELSSQWSASRGTSTLGWDRAKLAARDAWHRVKGSA